MSNYSIKILLVTHPQYLQGGRITGDEDQEILRGELCEKGKLKEINVNIFTHQYITHLSLIFGPVWKLKYISHPP